MKCADCGKTFNDGDVILYGDCGHYCVHQNNCLGEENMPNIKITAEVDGKQVPLETVSTETFEAIKALGKPKEIPVPVASIGNYPGNSNDRRLFLKISADLKRVITNFDPKVVAIELIHGTTCKYWKEEQQFPLFYDDSSYENIRPL